MKNLKDKRIRLLYPVVERTAGSVAAKRNWLDHGTTMDDVAELEGISGGDKLATAPTRPLWAYFRSLSGKEIYAADMLLAQEEVLFTVNWRAGIKPSMRVLYRGDMYDITRVDTLEGYKGDVKLYCKCVTAG